MPVVGDPAQTGQGPDRAAARCGQWAGPPGFVLAVSTKPAGLASRSGDLLRSSRDGTAGGSGDPGRARVEKDRGPVVASPDRADLSALQAVGTAAELVTRTVTR